MRYLTFLLIVLSSVGFFNYHAILSDSVQKTLFYVFVLLGFVVSLYKGRSLRHVYFPRSLYCIVLLSFVYSAVMATAFHQQGILISLMAILPFIFAYGSFYIFMKLDVPQQKIINTYLVLAVISSFVYFCNVFTMPNNIFGQPILNEDMSRGIIRIPVVFIEFMPMLVFYAINKLIDGKSKKWLLVIIFVSFMIFMAVIRQIIALTAVLGLWFYFRKVSVAKKLTLILLTVGVVVLVLPQIPMYKTMIELSEDQKDENEDDENVRIKAWRYYTYENQTNALSVFLGNGYPSFGNSAWGTMVDSETNDNGCFGADVGWAGYFWYFGGISTFCLLMLLILALKKKKPKESSFLNYWIVFLIITSVASGPILYYWQIIDITICLSMVFSLKSKDNSDSNELANIDDSTYNTKLQQFTRYPQLR